MQTTLFHPPILLLHPFVDIVDGHINDLSILNLLYQKIQQGFAQITLDEMIEIEQRWLDVKADGYFYSFRDKVPL